MYPARFNTYINSLVPSTQPYHDTSSVHPLVMWYIPTNYDSIAPVNYHSIVPSSFPTLENDTTEMPVMMNCITQQKITKQYFCGYIYNLQKTGEEYLKHIAYILEAFIINHTNIPTQEILTSLL